MLLENASDSMRKLGDELTLAKDRQIIKVGPARTIILEEADRLGVDLIVVGSHGRHGIRLLLGSTANAVLHGAACDVLAVRLKED
jgi:universal stress protein A